MEWNKYSIKQVITNDLFLISVMAFVNFSIHLIFSSNYGYFRDELYYLACSDHLAFGYVDHPPLSMVLLAAIRSLCGSSLLVIRFLPALAGGMLVFTTGLITRELGGQKFALFLSTLSVLISGVYLAFASFFSMNVIDFLLWALTFYIVILILDKNRPKLWILFGIVAGLGLLNKYSMGFLIVGVVIGLLLTPHRKHLVHKWFWFGAAGASVLFLPHILWQIINGFPSLEFMHNASQYKNLPMSPLQYVRGQVQLMNWVTAPVWILGLYYFLVHKEGRRLRVFGYLFLVVCLIMITAKAKLYYMAPVYTILIAAGALLFERKLRNRPWKWLRPVIVAVMVVRGVMIAPFVMPILPIETFISYGQSLGFSVPKGERKEMGELPQHFADMFGWENLVKTIADVFETLSQEEKDNCTIFARNYGQAGAIDFFGPKYGLPRAVCGHNNYWLWGPGAENVSVVLVIGDKSDVQGNVEDLSEHFQEVQYGATTYCKYCMPYEQNLPIFLCRSPKFNIQDVWLEFKHYE